MKIKLATIILFGVLLAGCVSKPVASEPTFGDQPGLNFWSYSFSSTLLSLKSSISQILVGGSSTTTPSSKLEVQGGFQSDNSTTTGQHYFGNLLQVANISAVPAVPISTEVNIYSRVDGVDQGVYAQFGSTGIETLLGGAGSGGCTTLPCLTDVLDTIVYTSGHYVRANGSAYTNSALLASDLSGTVGVTSGGTGLSVISTGDLLYGSASNVLSRLTIGSSGKFLTSNGTIPSWGDAVDLTTNQTITSGVKTFALAPISNEDGNDSTELVRFSQLAGLGVGQIYKDSVTAATTTSLTLSGVQNVDVGVTGVSGDRVLMAGQSSNPTNGCYTQAAGAWTRCTDYDAAAEVLRGTSFPVEAGTFNAGKIFIMNSVSVVTLGVDAITFASFEPSTLTGGDGITISGDDVSVDFATSRGLRFTGGQLDTHLSGSLTVDGNGLKVASTTPFDWTALHTFTDARPAVLNASSTTVGTFTAYGNSVLASAITASAFTSCTALETDINGALVCGSDSVGGGSGGGVATTTNHILFVSTGDLDTNLWGSMPAVEATIFGSDRNYITADLTAVNGYRIFAAQTAAGPTNGRIWLQYCVGTCTSAGTWANASSTGETATLAVFTANTNKVSSTIYYFPAAAQTLVTLRLIGGCNTGTCTASPSFREMGVELFSVVNPVSSQAWEKYSSLANPADIITPTTTGASIFVSGVVTSTAGLQVDGSTFVVQGDTDRVGILTLTPSQSFSVGSGNLFTIDSSGNASTTGYLNIGVSNAGLVLGAGDLFVGDDATVNDDLYVDGGNIGLTADTDLLTLAADSLSINGTVGINAASSALIGLRTEFTNSITGGASVYYGTYTDPSYTISTSNQTAQLYGSWVQPTVTPATGITASGIVFGSRVSVISSGAGDVTQVRGINIGVTNSGAGTIATAYGMFISSPTISAGAITNYAGIYIDDATGAGTTNIAIQVDSGNIIFNEGGVSTSDFRVEGDTNANLFFLDASTDTIGIGDASPAAMLTVGSGELFTVDSSGNASTTGYLNIGTANDGNAFSSGDLFVSNNAYVSGKLGVGTTTPNDYKFVINTSDSTTHFFQVASTTENNIFAITKDGKINFSSSTDMTMVPLTTGEGVGRSINITAGESTGFLAIGGALNLTAGSGFASGNVNINTVANFVSNDVLIQNNSNGNVGIGANMDVASSSLSILEDNATTHLFQVGTSTQTELFGVDSYGNIQASSTNPTFLFTDTDDASNDFYFSKDTSDRLGWWTTGTSGSKGSPGSVAVEGVALSGNGSFNLVFNPSPGATTVCQDAAGESIIGRCTSLRKFKDNIKDLEIGLDEIMKLQPRTFTWNEASGGNAGYNDLGFIAEEVEAVNPLLAEYGGKNGELTGVKYTQLTAALTNAIQELFHNFQMLFSWSADNEKRIEQLEKQNAILTERLNKLEND